MEGFGSFDRLQNFSSDELAGLQIFFSGAKRMDQL